MLRSVKYCTENESKDFKLSIQCIKSNQEGHTETNFADRFENFSKCHAVYLNCTDNFSSPPQDGTNKILKNHK